MENLWRLPTKEELLANRDVFVENEGFWSSTKANKALYYPFSETNFILYGRSSQPEGEGEHRHTYAAKAVRETENGELEWSETKYPLNYFKALDFVSELNENQNEKEIKLLNELAEKHGFVVMTEEEYDELF